MKLSRLLLNKNISPARLAGYVVSNFIGLAIVLAALQFYVDAGSIWQDEEGFINKDYLVVNKRVTAENTLGGDATFSEDELTELRAQPWVRDMGNFESARYHVNADVGGMHTAMFFETIPDEFVDAPAGVWHYKIPGDEIPMIISKDYLTLYNFGFAASAGMPQLSEQIVNSIPMSVTLSSEDGSVRESFKARIVGFSNRLNTILVPAEFMDWSNGKFGQREGEKPSPSRVIVDVSSPGDISITRYLDEHGLEAAGDKDANHAAFVLKLVIGAVMAIGMIITLLSFFILILSISLIMEKSRDKLHTLLLLGYPLEAVARPYRRLNVCASVLSLVLALAAVTALRAQYNQSLAALAGSSENASSMLVTIVTGVCITAALGAINYYVVGRRVKSAWAR